MPLSSVRVVCIPSTDRAFLAAVSEAIARQVPPSPEALEATIARLYPEARVVRRLLAHEPQPVWYAYRDGAYRPVPDATWHLDPAVAWASIDGSGVITAANPALEALVGDGSPLVGRPLSDFMLPENRALQARQFEAVLRGEVLHSIGRGCRPDGSEFVIEYVARLVDGEVHGWYRPASVAEVSRGT